MAQGKRFKPTRAQRERVKVFVEELEHGADVELGEILASISKAEKKGDVSAARVMEERLRTAKAAALKDRETTPEPPPAPKPEKLGKKEIQQRASPGIRTAGAAEVALRLPGTALVGQALDDGR